jgi:type IV pilus assembly protein PilA
MLNRMNRLREERAEGDKGFTLIELLVVVVIIGILIAIAIPLYLNYKKGANDKAAQSDLRGAISALEQCNADNNNYPTGPAVLSGTLTGCSATVNVSSGTTLDYYTNGSTYTLVGTNSDGNVTGGGNGWYCYASQAGGSVQKFTGTAPTTDVAVCAPVVA